MKAEADLVVLIKPQFEAERKQVGGREGAGETERGERGRGVRGRRERENGRERQRDIGRGKTSGIMPAYRAYAAD